MSWISKYDTTFIIFVSKKYNKRFKGYETFSYWLFYKRNKGSYEEYYEELEALIREYCIWQEKKIKEVKEIG